MTIFPVRLLLGICVAASAVAQRTTEPAPKAEASPAAPPPAATAKPAAPDAPAAPKKEPEILELPKIQVTAGRIKELDREIKRLDKAISREKKNVKASDLDKALNSTKLANAAAIFGGNSAAYMEEVAATRVRYMETERDLLMDMREPRTLDELKILQEELEKIRTMRRELDKAAHY